MARTDKEHCRYVVFTEYWSGYVSMIAEAIVESKHNPNVFMRLTSIPESIWGNDLKMLLQEYNVLFKYSAIYRVAITLLRDAMI